MDFLKHLLYDYFISIGMKESLATYANMFGLLIGLLIIVFIIDFVTRKILLGISSPNSGFLNLFFIILKIDKISRIENTPISNLENNEISSWWCVINMSGFPNISKI